MGHLHLVDGNMDQKQYKQVLMHHYQPSAEILFPKGNVIFQQDNEPQAYRKDCKKYIQSRNWNALYWPSQTPNLNTIENLWLLLDRKMHKSTSE